MSQGTTAVNTDFKKKTSFGRLIRIFKRLSRKTRGQKPICNATGCENLCARRNVYCSVNCATQGLTLESSQPTVIVSQAGSLNTVAPTTISTNDSTISIVPSEGNISCNSSLDVRSPKKPSFFLFASNSQNSLNSKRSGVTGDSAYETCSELDTESEGTGIIGDGKGKKLRETTMTALRSRDKEYALIEKSFRNGLPKQQILGIIRLQMPSDLVNSHEKHKRKVASENNRTERDVTHRMFHGTKTMNGCNPEQFLKGRTSFCRSGCGGCGIAQCGNRTACSRYSGKMWFAGSSGVSFGYCNSINAKVMFVVSVVSPVPGSILIIDKDEATLPEYMIIFK